MLILSQRVLDTLFGTDFGWQSRNQLAKWISKSEHRIGRGFVKVRGEGSGGKWKWFGICINYPAGNWKAKCTNWNNEATVLVCHCSRLPWRTRSLNKMSPTLLQFVAIFASNLQIQSTPSPLPPSLHSVVAASIAAAFWTKDSCKWLVKSQHSNAPRTGRGRPLPLRRHIDKKVQIKEENGLQKGRNQSRAKGSLRK